MWHIVILVGPNWISGRLLGTIFRLVCNVLNYFSSILVETNLVETKKWFHNFVNKMVSNINERKEPLTSYAHVNFRRHRRAVI